MTVIRLYTWGHATGLAAYRIVLVIVTVVLIKCITINLSISIFCGGFEIVGKVFNMHIYSKWIDMERHYVDYIFRLRHCSQVALK